MDNVNINIENLHINVYVNEETEDYVEFDIEDLEDAYSAEHGSYEDLSRAEQALYEGVSEEAEATAGDDYWDKLVADAADHLDYTGELMTDEDDEEVPVEDLEIGQVVRHTGLGTPDPTTDKHEGYEGVSLVGKIGVIRGFHKDWGVLVKWFDWADGHNGIPHYFGSEPDSTSFWWTNEDNLEVLG